MFRRHCGLLQPCGGEHGLHDAVCSFRARGEGVPDDPAYDMGQGAGDEFLEEQLLPERFADACAAAKQGLRLRQHPGYDHSYFFIASFIDDHIRHHADVLV